MSQPTGISQKQPRTPRSVMMCAALLLLTFIVYWPIRHFGFINFDDPAYVSQNTFVQQGLTPQGVHYAFTASVMGNWHPLVWLSLMLDGQLFHAAPGPIHLENAAWHAISGIILFFLLLTTTGSFWRSGLVAALFLIHPMHVESVAWIAERKDVLSTPPLLGAMLAYCRYARSSVRWQSVFWYGLTLLLFAITLMCKATGVTMPALLLLLDFWPLRRLQIDPFDNRRAIQLLVEKVPFVALSVLLAAVAVYAQQHAGAVKASISLPLTDRVSNAIVCYVLYLQKLIWPTDLAIYYPHPGTRPLVMVCASAGLLSLITWLVWRLRHRMPWTLSGWLWFLIALLPMIGLVQLGGLAMADRYSYLPSIGIFITIVWSAGELFRRSIHFNRAGVCVAFAMILVLCLLGRRQVWYWQDTRTLFSHDLDVTGPNPVACFLLGKAAMDTGDKQAAIDYLVQAVSLDPGNDKTFEILGNLLLKVDLTRAVVCYEQAVNLQPARTDYRIALAVAYTEKDDAPSLRKAARQLQQVLILDPGNPQATDGLKDITKRLSSK